MTEFPRDCSCGHEADDHDNGGGRCAGDCYDHDYGRYRCLCPYYTEEKL